MKSLSLPLYNFALALYTLGANLIAPFNSKAKKWIDGRKNIWDELQQLPSHPHRIWFHCSSLGEYEQALPMIQALQEKKQSRETGNSSDSPLYWRGGGGEAIITFFSPSGYEIVKKKNPDALVFYLPIDTKENAARFLSIAQPRLAVFVRYDLWYYYLTTLQKENTPSILISAVFREDTIFFQWYGSLFKSMLQCFTHIFVQDEHTKEVLLKNGFQNVTKACDTRIDRVASILNEGKKFPLIETFKGEKKLFLVGSLEPKDEGVVLPLLNHPDFTKQFTCIIAPHNIDKNYVTKIQAALNRKSVLYSSLSPALAKESNILIIDSIGILSRLYKYSDVAYIGGGFGEGLHNVLEPAVWGVPVFFGPKHHKFIEAAELVNRGGAFVVQDADELKTKTFNLLTNKDAHQKAAQAASDFIQENKGATEIILNTINSFPIGR
ncbi:MAG: glycosyltransferase N-terminal domain-containing protein [Chitinophagales bacterium]|nr:glycosyltransferase N-terminal domain-containing protein [Chitinophagales bacterium]